MECEAVTNFIIQRSGFRHPDSTNMTSKPIDNGPSQYSIAFHNATKMGQCLIKRAFSSKEGS